MFQMLCHTTYHWNSLLMLILCTRVLLSYLLWKSKSCFCQTLGFAIFHCISTFRTTLLFLWGFYTTTHFASLIAILFLGTQPKSIPARWRRNWGDWTGAGETRSLHQTPSPEQVSDILHVWNLPVESKEACKHGHLFLGIIFINSQWHLNSPSVCHGSRLLV